MNKFELVKEIISQRHGKGENLTLLDVGCRGCELKEYVKDLVQYRGIDLFQNSEGTVDFVLNIEKGLPMEDKSYDFVVALDLVEHLDDFQKGLEELLRVTRSYLIVMLPNLAYAPIRKEFLLRGSFSRLTDKYDLIYEKGGKGEDRHRWLTVLSQMDRYMCNFSTDKQTSIETIWFYGSRKRKLFAKIAKLLGLAPSWWVHSSLYILAKT
jgi:SAM-dependent methyltransferase